MGDVALPDSADMAIADAVRSPARAQETVADAEEVEPTPSDEDVALGVSSLKEARDRRALEQLSLGDEDDEAPATEAVAEHEVDDFEDSLEHDVAVPDTMGPRKKRHERRRVPSWDEIMFGDKSD